MSGDFCEGVEMSGRGAVGGEGGGVGLRVGLRFASSMSCVLAPRWGAGMYHRVIPGPSRCFVPGLGSWGPLGREPERGVRVGGWCCVVGVVG